MKTKSRWLWLFNMGVKLTIIACSIASCTIEVDNNEKMDSGLENEPPKVRINLGDLEEITPENASQVEELTVIQMDFELFSDVIWSPDGRLLAGATNKGVHFFESRNFEEIYLIENPFLNCIAFSPDSSILALGDSEGKIELWNVERWELLRTLEGHTDRVTSIAFSPDGATLASGSYDTTIQLWDVKSGNHHRTIDDFNNKVNSIAFSPDGNTIASGGNEGMIYLIDAAPNWKDIKKATRYLDAKSICYCVVFSPDGHKLATGHAPDIKLWDLSNKDSPIILDLFSMQKPQLSVEFSPDGLTLVSGDSVGPVRLWKTSNGAFLSQLDGHTDWVFGVAFSPDGKTIASASYDKTLRLWGIP